MRFLSVFLFLGILLFGLVVGTHSAELTPTPRSTRLPICTSRRPSDRDLIVLINQTYPISSRYEPQDLVTLGDYLPSEWLLGYPTQVRKIIIPSLLALLEDMRDEGLYPTVISGYRSYYQQKLAREKWLVQYPDRADQLSAMPGTSEHQLGTTIDFGSPELSNEFHTNFYKTAEGAWLLENAHHYGFTLSYPPNSLDVTGFYYEPWHYRYVGRKLATQLHARRQSLTAYLLANTSPPCLTTAP